MTTGITHLQWCKDRAIPYCDKGDFQNAFLSFMSDMRKSSETDNHPALCLAMPLYTSGDLSTGSKMKEFINGFN